MCKLVYRCFRIITNWLLLYFAVIESLGQSLKFTWLFASYSAQSCMHCFIPSVCEASTKGRCRKDTCRCLARCQWEGGKGRGHQAMSSSQTCSVACWSTSIRLKQLAVPLKPAVLPDLGASYWRAPVRRPDILSHAVRLTVRSTLQACSCVVLLSLRGSQARAGWRSSRPPSHGNWCRWGGCHTCQ